MGHSFDIAFEYCIFTHCNIGEGFLRDSRHMAGTLLEAAEFATIAHRSAHHLCQLRHYLVIHLTNGGDTGHHQVDALLQGACRPAWLCRSRPCSGLSRCIERQRLALSKHGAVDRRDTFEYMTHSLLLSCARAVGVAWFNPVRTHEPPRSRSRLDQSLPTRLRRHEHSARPRHRPWPHAAWPSLSILHAHHAGSEESIRSHRRRCHLERVAPAQAYPRSL